MEELSKPSNILPDIVVDRVNNRIVATFPPIDQSAYCGIIHPSVKDVLHRAAFKKDSIWDFTIYFTQHDENEKKDEIEFDDEWVVQKWQPEEESRTALFKPIVDMNTFTKNTIFRLMDFVNPLHFGVHLNEDNQDFVDMSNMMLKKSGNFRQITMDEVKYGAFVIYKDKYRSDKRKGQNANKWNQHFWRGRIIATNTYNTDDVLESVLLQKKVYVEMFDIGVTYHRRIHKLFFYNKATCNYGMPDLFERIPIQGFRVILSTLQPYYAKSWTWAAKAISSMNTQLSEPSNNGCQSLIKLDIQFVDNLNRVIVATDVRHGVRPPRPLWSFVDWCIQSEFAYPLNNSVMYGSIGGLPGPNFYPAPKDTGFLEKERVRTIELRAEGLKNVRDPNSHFKDWTFLNIYSPMEVEFHNLQPQEDVSLLINKNSMNCRFMDPRLADLSITADTYDPLLAVATDLYIFSQENKKFYGSSNTTILNPFPCSFPIMQMLSFPVVELIMVAPNQCAAVQLYINGSQSMAYAGNILLPFQLTQEDIGDMNHFRHVINEKHCDPKCVLNNETFRKRLIKFFFRRRAPQLIPPPDQLNALYIPDLPTGQFIQPKLICTNYY